MRREQKERKDGGRKEGKKGLSEKRKKVVYKIKQRERGGGGRWAAKFEIFIYKTFYFF